MGNYNLTLIQELRTKNNLCNEYRKCSLFKPPPLQRSVEKIEPPSRALLENLRYIDPDYFVKKVTSFKNWDLLLLIRIVVSHENAGLILPESSISTTF